MNPKWKKSHMTNMRSKRKGARKSKKLAIPGAYNFSRYAQNTVGTGFTISLSNLVTQGNTNFTFALNKIQGFADFVNLFDMYQINKVDLYFRLIQNPDNTGTTNVPGTYYPCLWYSKDYDDEVTGMTLTQIREKQNVKRFVLRPNVIK